MIKKAFSILLAFTFSLFMSQLNAQATFSQIKSIFQASCTIGCHNSTDNTGNLNLTGTDQEVYDRLINIAPTNPAAVDAGYSRVRPGYPERSFLVRKCNNNLYQTAELPNESFGNTMPNNAPPLANNQIELIRQWVYEGAPLTGNVVNTSTIDSYYLNGGINSIPEPPPIPTEAGSFQLHLGKLFLEPQSETEYFIKYDLELPADVYVDRIELFMANQSHHFILYKFLPGQDNQFPEGLRIQNPQTGAGSSGSSSTLVNAWQISYDTHLPEETAYLWNSGSVLDMNYHVRNYNLDSVLAVEAYVNIYTTAPVPITNIMYSDLITNLAIYIPNDNAPHVFSRSDYDPSATRYWDIWQLTSHTHKYGTDFDIFMRNADGTDGEQIYEGFFNTDYTFNQGYYGFSHPPIRQFETQKRINPREGLIQRATFRNNGSSPVFFGLTTDDEMMLYYIQYTLGDLIETSGIEHLANSSFTVFPNPSQGEIFIYTNLKSASDMTVRISDISGRLISVENFGEKSSGSHTLKLNSILSAGTYIFQLQTSESISVQKLIIQ
jgi:hypothetical protein